MTSPNMFISKLSQYTFTEESKELFEKNNSSFINEINSLIERLEITPQLQDHLYTSNPKVNNEIIWKHQLYKETIFANLKLQSVIFLQKHIRSFISKNKLNMLINSLIIKDSLPKVIRIQKHFRQYYIKKHTKRNLLIYSILKQRNEHYSIIKRNISRFFLSNFTKKSLICNRIIEDIIPKIIKLQYAYKTHYMYKTIHNILTIEKENHVLYYPFYANTVILKIFIDAYCIYNNDGVYNILKQNIKLYTFDYCYIRKMFVLYLNKILFPPGKYLCQFIIDGNECCDGRYEIATDQNGKDYYNIITI
jgi:hypothetical protein